MNAERKALLVDPAFILLFSVRLKGAFKGFTGSHPGVVPIPADDARVYLEGLAEFERRLLGAAFLETRRITRWPLGRIVLEGLADEAPAHADVYLLSHKSGVALWEVWLPAPSQSFDAARWIAWLDSEAEDGLIVRLWRFLGSVNHEITGKVTWSGLYLPLILLRLRQQPLAAFIDQNGPDLVRLLLLDRSQRALKPGVVAEELSRDYCARQGGMTLLSRRSGLDLHDQEGAAGDVPPAGLPPKSALPFLVTLELLLLEHAVLQHLYDRLSRHMPKSVEELITLKQEVIDGLEEYYGAITNATRFSDAVTADGERLLGVEDIYDAVMERLEAVSFTITTRSQRHMTLLQFWLTIVFGASEIGFIAASLSTWYYRTGLIAVLAWTVGAALVTGTGLALMLKGKVE
ncbi:hypothetical protein SKTS_22160 [Sulfurimicrobium lacus]|uniref:Uncharacterized protein n=1 Tax=Sulfurimicrobium lacus TaxID=2715678 RepID=A0A6F8VDB4_9PROT|nr:hypothetical protein [Sulfurimicrobium lacus]BCB27330.1 hypothetical protein SKTS_22160 [Sulfurimicrobium lacus]